MPAFSIINPSQPGFDPMNVVGALFGAGTGMTFDLASFQLTSGPSSAAYYDGSLGLGVGAGLLLTSGTIPGTANTVQYFGVSNNMAGDPLLDQVVNAVFATRSYDATILEVSFTVTDPTIQGVSFNVVFGSDEYPEWVNQFVDIAAIWVNGTNVAYFNNDPNAPLSVIGSNLSKNYFINNSTMSGTYAGVAQPGIASLLPIEYDGVSAPLTVFAPVHAGVNTLRIGIADTGDHIYDSGIFISNMAGARLPLTGITLDRDGSAGNDRLIGTEAPEYMTGQAGDDDINGGSGDDVIAAGTGDDFLAGDAGDDSIDGAEGADTANYAGLRADYAVTANADGSWTVADQRAGAPDGSDTLLGVETVQFADVTLDLATMQPVAPVAAPVTTIPVPPAYVPPPVALPASFAPLTVDAAEDGNPVAADAMQGLVGAGLSVANLPATLPAGVTYDPATHAFYLDPTDAAFQPLAFGQSQTITLDYAITDGTGTTPAQVVFTVAGRNDAPVAGAAAAAAVEDGATVAIDALAGASDVDAGTVLAVVAAPAASADPPQAAGGEVHGKAGDTPAGTAPPAAFGLDNLPAGIGFDPATGVFTLDPTDPAFQPLAAGQLRSIVVPYGISDGTAVTAAQAVFTVTGVNDLPVAVGQAAIATQEDGGAVLDRGALLAAVQDPDLADTLEIQVDNAALPAGVAYHHVPGTTTVSTTTYYGFTQVITVPTVDTLGFDGTDPAYQSLAAGETLDVVVDYRVSDGTGAAAAQAVFHVAGANDAPVVAGPATAAATEGAAPVVLDALARATDIDDGAVLSVVAAPPPAGEVESVVNALGVVEKAAPPPPPIVAFDPATLPAGVAFDAAANSFVLDPAAPAVRALAAGQVRSIAIDYGVSDGTVATAARAVFTVTGTNDAPVVSGPLALTVTEDDAARILDLTANASDVDTGDVLRPVVAGALPDGFAATTVIPGYYLSPVAAVQFNPRIAAFQSLAAGESRTVHLDYAISDGLAAAPAAIDVTVTGLNDAPVATPALLTVAEDAPAATLDALAGATDADHDAVLSVVGMPAVLPDGIAYDAASHAFAIDPAAAVFQALAEGEAHEYDVAYGISDGTVTTATMARFVVVGRNDAPVVAGLAGATPKEDGNVVSVNALGTTDDIDTSNAAMQVLGLPAALPAGVTYDAAGRRFDFDPAVPQYQWLAKGQTLQIAVDYQVSDGYATVPTQVVFALGGANDAPVVAGPVLAAAAEGAAPLALDLLAASHDIDAADALAVATGKGNPVTATVTAGSWSAPVAFSLAGGTLGLDPAQFNALRGGETVEVTVAYTVTDGTAAASASARVTVTGENDAPTALTLSAAHIAENSAPGSTVGLLGLVDADRGEAGTWQLLGSARGLFAVDGNRLVVAPGAALDFETAAADTVVLRGTDSGGAAVERSIAIAIDNIAGITAGGTSKDDVFNAASATATTNEEDTVDGAGGNDLIDGRGGDDTLRGGNGDDTLLGAAGNDLLEGGSGNDALHGGDGDDTFLVAGNEALGDSIAGGSGGETLGDRVQVGGNGALGLARFDAGQAGIERWAGNGREVVGTGSADTLNFAALRSVSGLAFVDGGSGDDALTGSGFADDLRGGAGGDQLTGGGGDDILAGGDGTDTLWGGIGNDVLVGGVGPDMLRGGLGLDRFRFLAPNEAGDTIQDFAPGEDSVEVLGSAFARLGPGTAAVLQDIAGLTAAKTGGASPLFLYMASTQTLYFDATGTANGTMDALRLATLSGVGALSAADIRVI